MLHLSEIWEFPVPAAFARELMMSEMVDDERHPRLQVRLVDLISWVVAAALVSAVCRSAGVRGWPNSLAGFEPVLDVTGVALAVFFGLALAREAIDRSLKASAHGDRLPLGAVGWRLGVVALLAAFALEEGRLLGAEGQSFELVATSLMPLAATMAMAGILMGMRPDAVRRRPRKWAALSVLIAGAAGVAIMASWSVIPYLILLALEAVSCAKHHPDLAQLSRAGLNERFVPSAWEAAGALGCCLACGLAVSRDLRRPAGQAPAAARIGLFASTIAAAAASGWLVAVTIPRLHEHLAEGLGMTVKPAALAAIVLGFAGVAAGLAARAADRPGQPEIEEIHGRRWPWWVAVTLVALAALAMLAVNVDQVVGSYAVRASGHPGLLARLLGSVDTLGNWFGWVLTFALRDIWAATQGPEWLALALAEAWVGWHVILMLLKPPAAEIAPLDAVWNDRRALYRFAVRWAATTILMVAAMPVLFVAGLVALHGLFRAGN